MHTRYAMRRTFCGTALALTLATAGLAFGEDAPATPANPAPPPLGRNVRLEFMVRPAEKDGQAVSILTAHPWFKTSGSLSSKSEDLKFAVSGGVGFTDAGDVLLMYDLKIEAGNKHGGGVFKANASVQLHSGQTLPVARMGDKALLIRATILDDKPADEKPVPPTPAE